MAGHGWAKTGACPAVAAWQCLDYGGVVNAMGDNNSIDASLAWLLAPPIDASPATPWARLRACFRRPPLAVLRVLMLLGAGAALLELGLRPQPLVNQVAEAPADPIGQQPEPILAPFSRAALRPLTPADAVAWNAAALPSAEANPAAAAFVAPFAQANDYRTSLNCLTQAIYYEAANEPDGGQRAVAQVVLNRMRHVAYPHTVCGVIFQGATRRNACQFTFACDGALSRAPKPEGWRRAERVAAAALAGYVHAPVGLATHYHANYVVPYWAASLEKVATIGAHIFYRWGGYWGTRAAFSARYVGGERGLALAEPVAAEPLPPASRDAAPVAVSAAERPVIIPAAAARAAEGDPMAKAPATVGLQQRWILPHPASAAVSAPGDAAIGGRRIILPSEPPAP